MSAPLLSIALPVRNGADFLAAALDSILAQTYSDFVLHVSDNASDDATADILADYAARDQRMQVSRSAELIPQAANMNRAMGLAQSQWVHLFCHDDLMRSDCLAQVAAVIGSVRGTNVALIGHGEQHLYPNGWCDESRDDGPPRVYSGREIVSAQLCGTPGLPGLPSVTTATVERAAFARLGGFDPRWIHFDTFAWLRLLVTADYAWLPAPLTTNRIHGKQVAADARASLRSIADYRTFVPEFLAGEARGLKLGPGTKLRARIKPLGIAATTLAVDALTKRGQSARIAVSLPWYWRPAMPALTLRALRSERRRVAHLTQHVPLELIYP